MQAIPLLESVMLEEGRLKTTLLEEDARLMVEIIRRTLAGHGETWDEQRARRDRLHPWDTFVGLQWWGRRPNGYGEYCLTIDGWDIMMSPQEASALASSVVAALSQNQEDRIRYQREYEEEHGLKANWKKQGF